MTLLEIAAVSKTFWIPTERRDTVREHVLTLFRPRRFRRLDALQAVSFALERGETLGIMGPNGSGKSTLLKIVSGVYPPDEGTVRLRGVVTPILELGVGWSPELDAIDNVFLLGSVMGLSLDEIRRGMAGILAFAELEAFARLKLKHYSTGMASRLAYAVAFRAVRDILVLDEIFAVGDAGFKARCEERYRQLKSAGHTVLIVSHDPRTIASFCDRALLLDAGRLIMEGTGAEVAERYVSMLTGPAAVPSV
jgi:ABC-type polysaccharide/polyol phosphate transport system ATPase subunit